MSMDMNPNEVARLKERVLIKLEDPKFIKSVQYFRRRNRIRQSGFRSREDREHWEFDLFTVGSRAHYFTSNPVQMEGIKVAVSSIRDGKPFEAQWLYNHEWLKVPAIKFGRDLARFISRHNLTPRYTKGIMEYILTNDRRKVSFTVVTPQPKHDVNGNLVGFEVAVDALTRKEEWDEIWKDIIAPYQKKMKSYKTFRTGRGKLTYDIAKRIEVLKSKPYQMRNYRIAKIVSEEYNEELGDRGPIMPHEVDGFLHKLAVKRSRLTG